MTIDLMPHKQAHQPSRKRTHIKILDRLRNLEDRVDYLIDTVQQLEHQLTVLRKRLSHLAPPTPPAEDNNLGQAQ